MAGKRIPMWLWIVWTAVIVLRIPSLFEPYWYGDEGIYLTLGQAMRDGRELYRDIHDNKPPLLYVAAAVVDGELGGFKFILLVWNIVTIGLFALLATRLSESKKLTILSTTVFALLTTLPFLEGNIANAELFFLPFTIGAVLLLWNKGVDFWRVALAGILLGIGGLFKIPALAEVAVWPLVWLVTKEPKKWRKTLLLAATTLLPLLISGVYYWSAGAGREYFEAAWQQNIPYLSSWQVAATGEGIFSLKGRLVVLMVATSLTLGLSLTWGRKGTIVGMWGMWSLFAALLSGRPYPHYLLQVVPPLSLCFLIWNKAKPIGVGLWALVIGAFFQFHFYAYPVFSYYSNYIQWAAGIKTTENYFAHFDSQLFHMYETAEVIRSHSSPSDQIFIWGDRPMLYALSHRLPAGKYTAKYHIEFFGTHEVTLQTLTHVKPLLIIAYDREETFPGLPEFLATYYAPFSQVGDARIYRLSPSGL